MVEPQFQWAVSLKKMLEWIHPNFMELLWSKKSGHVTKIELGRNIIWKPLVSWVDISASRKRWRFQIHHENPHPQKKSWGEKHTSPAKDVLIASLGGSSWSLAHWYWRKISYIPQAPLIAPFRSHQRTLNKTNQQVKQLDKGCRLIITSITSFPTLIVGI